MVIPTNKTISISDVKPFDNAKNFGNENFIFLQSSVAGGRKNIASVSKALRFTFSIAFG